jgi:hypothetical protein
VEVKGKGAEVFSVDERPGREEQPAGLAKLPPVFQKE